ncbi:MAG: nucleotidyltransferase family protein [Armatimonadota bacterium]
MTEPKIPLDMENIAAFCRKWKITSFALFGSVLREDFGPDSDVDVLVVFAPGVRYSLLTLPKIARELSELFGRKVDLVERRWIENSRNPIRRQEILGTAEEVYRAAA